jgi:hypothetical protein
LQPQIICSCVGLEEAAALTLSIRPVTLSYMIQYVVYDNVLHHDTNSAVHHAGQDLQHLHTGLQSAWNRGHRYICCTYLLASPSPLYVCGIPAWSTLRLQNCQMWALMGHVSSVGLAGVKA